MTTSIKTCSKSQKQKAARDVNTKAERDQYSCRTWNHGRSVEMLSRPLLPPERPEVEA